MVNKLTEHYSTTISNILDDLTLLKLKRTQIEDRNPWFNGSLNNERRSLRQTARNWKQHPSSAHLKLLRQSRNAYNRKILNSKKEFFRTELENARTDFASY